MHTIYKMMFVGAASLAAAIVAPPQQVDGQERASGANDTVVSRMMAFDANKDGEITKAEVSDQRLHRLFDRADADKNGVVTRSELNALAAREATNDRGGPSRFGPPGGPPGRGGFGPPRPGEVLPRMFQDRLNLTAEQRSQIDALQKDVDARLERILSAEQRKELESLRTRGPGGFGPPPRRGNRPPGPGPDGPPPPPDGPRPEPPTDA